MDVRMKKILPFVSIGLILLAIPLTVFFVGQRQEIRKRAAPASTLTLSPATVTKKVGETFTLEAKIDTGTNQVGVVQIRVVYDPAILQAQDITNGPLAPSISVSGKIDATGKASITVGAKSTSQPIKGAGTVAILTMKALTATAGPVSVRFTPLPDTYANALGEQSNVLVGTTPANITVVNADGSAGTATAAPTATPSATIKPTVSLTATPTRLPTPTPTTALTLTLTPTPTQMATSGAGATSSAVTIASIEPNEQVDTRTPTFAGTAAPGSTITLTIYSTPRTVIVTVDANGNWTYTPEEGLEPGPHTVVAMASDATTGQTQTATVPFVVAAGDSATESAMPVAGNTETTILLVFMGAIFLLSGLLAPVVLR